MDPAASWRRPAGSRRTDRLGKGAGVTATPPGGLGAATVLGYPRIGPRRELKRALESYWDGASTGAELLAVGRRLRAATWRRLAGLGLAAPPSNTFSLYDHVLDTAVLLGAVPERYRDAGSALDAYFAMARGTAAVAPQRMTKWFDTNYHSIVPEIGPSTAFRLADDKPLAEAREARALGVTTRPVLLGPVTFLLLAEPAAGSPAGFRPLDRLDDVLEVYGRLLAALAADGVGWVQLDEPALVTDRTGGELAAVGRAYHRLAGLADRPRLLVASYFGDLAAALPVLVATPVEAIGLDLVRGRSTLPPADLDRLAGKTVVAGVVSGRDVWRTDRPAVAEQKVAEVVELADLLTQTPDGAAPVPVPAPPDAPPATPDGATAGERRGPYPARAVAQAARLRLPLLPVTTTGSFPQTGELRAARAAVAAGRLDRREYERRIEAEIERVIRLQERLGLDVLVH